ncbi:MAG: hypothetical protein KC591_13450, partial [Gemmatimonadetes bacterium]|nr:hypothetical protein [Gemmatimonadota bacterium]
MTARRVRLARFPFRFIFPALLLLLAPFADRPAAAATISARVEIEPSSRDVAVSNQGVIAMRPGELPLAQVDGAGTLPVAVRAFFVPAGFEVADVRVTRRDETTVATGRLLSTLPRAESEARLELGAPGEAARDAYVLGGGNLAGYRIENVALLPYRFDQATGRLLAARTLDVSLELRPVAARAAGDLVRERHSPEADRVFAEAVAALVANPQDVPAPDASASRSLPTADGFAPQDIPTIDGTAVDMVIVTPAAFEATFQTLADWKTKKGVPTVVRTVEWIEANYPDGHDQAERIRFFLRDAYTKWGTYMLLLGGDYSLVPPRSAWNTYFFGGVEIPTDQYYACLDGTWNDDGDQFWGEGSSGAGPGDNADLFPDVFIGRAPVDNVTQ